MTIDFSTVLRGLDSSPLMHDGNEFTLAIACVNALLAQYADEQASGDEKMQRWTLARKLWRAAEVSVTSEEIVMLKKLVGRAFSPIVVGRVYEMMEN